MKRAVSDYGYRFVVIGRIFVSGRWYTLIPRFYYNAIVAKTESRLETRHGAVSVAAPIRVWWLWWPRVWFGMVVDGVRRWYKTKPWE